jgi:hypothetical protein
MSYEARARLPGLHRGSGLTDREVAAATGLRLTYRREISKNPCTPGQLRTAEAAGGPALINRALWDAAKIVRTKYARRHRGPVSRRTYALATLLRWPPAAAA